MLVNHTDSQSHGLTGGGEVQWLTPIEDLAIVHAVHTVQTVHKR